MSYKGKSSSGKCPTVPAARPAVEAGEAASPVPVTIGIGASAGGLEALKQVLAGMPADCGLCFVLIMHHSPDRPSLLPGILERHTQMEVVTAKEEMSLRPNTVFVIPPAGGLILSSGRFILDEHLQQRLLYHPIDHFFTTLAAEAGRQAIAVILSGSGSDGTEGAKAVKEAGGIVVVQEPASSGYPDMPRSAIDAGVADLALAAGVMPARIVEISRNLSFPSPPIDQAVTFDEELRAVFAIVKAETGDDFSSYKRNTIMRRIERRMAVNGVVGLNGYIAFLHENPREAHALAREILIGVTSFFRDPEAFDLLAEKIIPALFEGRDPDDPVRIWHAACATGEEVYSLAILIREYLEKHRLTTRVQIYATDIDEAAIGRARAGLYPDGIGADMEEERLKRFFIRNDDAWQVTKQLRMVVFAHHNLIKDPPFSKLDLLVCRNFLIYLNSDIQKRLIPLFHQVLKPGGILFLGSAETVGPHNDLFTPIDKKWKIFARQEGERPADTLFPFAGPVRRIAGTGRPVRPSETLEPGPVALAEKLLLERYFPARVIVNDKYEVVYFSNRTGAYLVTPAGVPTRDLLKMAKEELRPALRAAIYKAFIERKEIVLQGIKVGVDGGETTVNVIVAPLKAPPDVNLALVIFEPAPPSAALTVPSGEAEFPGDEASRDSLVRQLEEQLRVTHEQLQATSEQLEASNEGFKSANEELVSVNEELQSTNEELQSTNEELETSKEELQALNEELLTVNAELQSKVEELNQSSSDLQNFFTSSEIAAIFLDRGLILRRFSPAMAAIFNLIPADIGRPFRYLAGIIDWSNLPGDAQTVLEKLVPIDREVTALKDDRSFVMRVLPYRTTDGRIDGIVVTLIDITERKRMENALRESEERLRLLIEGVRDYAIFMLDVDGRVSSWNEGARRLNGWDEQEVLGRHFSAFFTRESVAAGHPEHELEAAAGEGRYEEQGWRARKDGSKFLAEVVITAIRDGMGKLRGFAKIVRDITERRRNGEAIQRYLEELRAGNEELTRFSNIAVGRIPHDRAEEGSKRILPPERPTTSLSAGFR